MPSAKTLHQDSAESDSAPDGYACDEFRMYEFKVSRCVRGRTHDWTDCPFAHPGEKARRRDPRRHHYSADPCPDFRCTAACPRGDSCALAHGVFECWLHPARYRTQPCRDGPACRRKVCFFAHSPRQLRLLPSPSPCLSCSFPVASSAASSPTSTLIGLSHFSPPLTPSSPGVDYKYKTLFADLVNSMEAMDLYTRSQGSAGNTGNQLLLSPPPYGHKGEELKEGGGDGDEGYKGCPDLDWVEELLM